VRGRAGFADSSSGYREIGVRVWDESASAYIYLDAPQEKPADAGRMLTIAMTPELTTDDWVEIYAYQTSGSAKSLIAGSTSYLRQLSATMTRIP
jgi:hypothetical protein